MNQVFTHLRGRTGRLAATYLAVIMTLTLVFSLAVFSLATNRLDRPGHMASHQEMMGADADQMDAMFQKRADDTKADMAISLLLLNTLVLLAGAVVSYLLARMSLGPIEASMEAQSRFISDASHELRTPLTALVAMNEVALRKKQLTLPAAKAILAQNVDEAEKLRVLSDQLLGVVKQEGALVQTEPVAVQDIVADVLTIIVPIAQKKQITVTDETQHVTVHANKPLLQQVLVILAENAIKYSPDHSRVIIRSYATAQGHAIAVIDHGIGIRKTDQPRIFDRFYRVDQSRSRMAVAGTGLGLAIAKAICDRQGMKLTVSSEIDKGSTFTVTVKK